MGHDIFLSYASEDVSRASELVRVLEDEGWTVWWDREIKPGQDFEIEIDKAISDSRAVMVLWSVFSVASNWVRNEANEAKELNKLIPVKLDDVKVPLSFRALNTIELIDWPNSRSVLGISMLKSSLNRVLQSGSPASVLKRPSTDDEMTLSVRVASRVADLVRAGGPVSQISDDIELKFEKCITDICLDIVALKGEERQDYVAVAVDKLSEALSADYAIAGNFEPGVATLTELHCLDTLPLPDELAEKITRHFSAQIEAHGMDIFTNSDVPRSDTCDLLYLFENRSGSNLRVTCLLANTKKWPSTLQRRLTQMSLALFSAQTVTG